MTARPAQVAMLRTELIGFLSRRGQDAQDAEDIVQEAFARFHRAGHNVDDADARPLLFVICRNLGLDHWRGSGRERTRRAPLSPEQLDTVGEPLSGDDPAADRRVIARQDLAAAAEVIRTLPPKCRDAFLLHRFEDLTYRQIADRLGVSVSMVEKHLAEALRRLKSARGR